MTKRQKKQKPTTAIGSGLSTFSAIKEAITLSKRALTVNEMHALTGRPIPSIYGALRTHADELVAQTAPGGARCFALAGPDTKEKVALRRDGETVPQDPLEALLDITRQITAVEQQIALLVESKAKLKEELAQLSARGREIFAEAMKRAQTAARL